LLRLRLQNYEKFPYSMKIEWIFFDLCGIKPFYDEIRL